MSSSAHAAASASQPWIEKYRPNSVEEVVAHENIVSTISKLVDAKRMPHLLLYGPPGTGKTSTILAIAKKMYKNHFKTMTLELNASDDRKLDVVRTTIKTFASTRHFFNTDAKLIILDEADSITTDAQMALRRVIEQYTSNARFCLICNYASKIIPALQSRCTKFRFQPLDPALIRTRLEDIAVKENVQISTEGMDAVLEISQGDMRRCLNVLQSASMSTDGNITAEAVYSTVGAPSPAQVQSIMNGFMTSSLDIAAANIQEMQRAGLALASIVAHATEFVLCTKFPPSVRAYLLQQLGRMEVRLAGSCNESVQALALVGLFQIARSMMSSELAAANSRMEQD